MLDLDRKCADAGGESSGTTELTMAAMSWRPYYSRRNRGASCARGNLRLTVVRHYILDWAYQMITASVLS